MRRMGEFVTVYWVAAPETEGESWRELCEKHGAAAQFISSRLLATELSAAGARGAVVVIVDSDRDASRALGLGADEVLRAGEFSHAEFDGAVERARLRASARAMRDRRAAAGKDQGLALLGSALGEQLLGPLQIASSECAQFAHTLRVLLSINDDLVGWARLSAPTDELRRLAARRLSAPSSSEVQQALSRMQSALDDAGDVAGRLRQLVADSEHDGCLPADRLASDFAKLIAPQLAPFCEIEVDETSDCPIAVETSFFLSVAAVLVSNALGALEAAGKQQGHLLLCARQADGLAVLTLEDDSGEMVPDLQAAQTEERAGASAGLQTLRERLQRRGGDLLVQSDSTGTQVRVVFGPTEDRLGEEPFYAPIPKRPDRPDLN